MQKKLITFFFNNLKLIGLIFLITLTVSIAAYSNQKKNLSKNQNIDFINNIYFKKTLNEIVNNLEPRYKKYNHKIKSGETFDKILSEYSIEKEEIIAIKESLSKKFRARAESAQKGSRGARHARLTAIKGATDAGVEADCFHPTEENKPKYAD